MRAVASENTHVRTWEMVKQASEGQRQWRPWWRLLAMLTCKLFYKTPPLVHVRTLFFFFFSLLLPPLYLTRPCGLQNAPVCTFKTSPCLTATRPHSLNMYTRRRFESKHGGFSACATTTHTTTHTNTQPLTDTHTQLLIFFLHTS